VPWSAVGDAIGAPFPTVCIAVVVALRHGCTVCPLVLRLPRQRQPASAGPLWRGPSRGLVVTRRVVDPCPLPGVGGSLLWGAESLPV
jgi:hypothetical protein